MKCKECGNELKSDEMVCQKCGVYVEKENKILVKVLIEKRKKLLGANKRNALAIVILILFVLIFIICVVFHTHTIESKVATPATCFSEGLEVEYCTECDKVLEEKIISKVEHDWQPARMTDATYSKKGKLVYSCTACAEEKIEVIQPLSSIPTTDSFKSELNKKIVAYFKGLNIDAYEKAYTIKDYEFIDVSNEKYDGMVMGTYGPNGVAILTAQTKDDVVPFVYAAIPLVGNLSNPSEELLLTCVSYAVIPAMLYNKELDDFSTILQFVSDLLEYGYSQTSDERIIERDGFVYSLTVSDSLISFSVSDSVYLDEHEILQK